MFRMGRIIVSACVGKGSGAIPVFVDMHGIKSGRAQNALIGKLEKLTFNQDASIRRVIKAHHSA